MEVGSNKMSKPQRLADVEAAASELAGEIGDFVRSDASFLRARRRAGGSEVPVEDMHLALHRISAAPIDEMDRLILELQTMRDLVRHEGERLEREINDYVSLSETAMASTRIIAGGLAHCRSAAGQSRLPLSGTLHSEPG
jgi:hypothetical protein